MRATRSYCCSFLDSYSLRLLVYYPSRECSFTLLYHFGLIDGYLSHTPSLSPTRPPFHPLLAFAPSPPPPFPSLPLFSSFDPSPDPSLLLLCPSLPPRSSFPHLLVFPPSLSFPPFVYSWFLPPSFPRCYREGGVPLPTARSVSPRFPPDLRRRSQESSSGRSGRERGKEDREGRSEDEGR